MGNMIFNGNIMRNKLYKNNDLRSLYGSLDKNVQSKKKKNGRKEVIMTGSGISDKELQ